MKISSYNTSKKIPKNIIFRIISQYFISYNNLIMKILLAMTVLLSVSFSYTHAGDVYEKDVNKESMKVEDRAVISYDFDLEVKQENGKVTASWNNFPENRGFEWYKLVYSTSNINPVYPNDTTVFVWERLQLENTFKLDANKNNHYIRLCALVINDNYSKDRYCSETQKIKTTQSDFISQNNNKIEYKKTDQKTDQKKDIKLIQIKEVTFSLSEMMRTKINELLENFILRLEEKEYSDEQIAVSIDVVVKRLEILAKQVKYKNIAGYMIQELKSMQEKYSDPLNEFESIFDGF